MKRAAIYAVGALVIAGGIAIPAVAFAQDSQPEYCNLATPAVRDVVQDAPAISVVLNLDPALPDATIEANRQSIGCGPSPKQTPEQARAAVCSVLTEAKVEELVSETNNPDAAVALETVRPGLGAILAASRSQLKCDVKTVTEAPPSKAPATKSPQLEGKTPVRGVETGVR
jgi:hypothetical protein